VPWLGLKRGLVEDMVVSPYATMLVLPLVPRDAMDNLKRLIARVPTDIMVCTRQLITLPKEFL